MPIGRYDNREILRNTDGMYRKKAFERGLSGFNQFGTSVMSYPTTKQIASVETVSHLWTVGDRLYKLAHRYYHYPEMWWIIAWFNQKPTEAHIDLGDPIYIPIPLDDALRLYNG